MSQVTIIREKKQSLRIEIQTAYRIDSPSHVSEKVHDGRPSPGVFDRGKIASGFIQKQDDFRFERGESLPVDFDVISGGIGFKTQDLNDLSVDRNPSFDHHPLGFPPRSNPGFGYYLLNSLQCQWNSLFLSLIQGEVSRRGYLLRLGFYHLSLARFLG